MIGLFYIHPLTIPFFILIGATPYKSRFFLLYFFVFLHELSHMAVSIILNEKVSSLRLFPWGCTLNLSSLPGKSHSLPILMAGPLFNLIMYFLDIFPTENLSLALFNLMPVMPLDGGVIVNIIFGRAAFFISVIFIAFTIALCLYFHFPPILPILLAVVLFIGEKNRFDKTISAKIIGYFNGKT